MKYVKRTTRNELPVTFVDLTSSMTGNETNNMSPKEASREISKLLVKLLRLIHFSTKLGLRTLRHVKRISPGTVLNGAQQLNENDIGIAKELIKMFLNHLYEQVLSEQRIDATRVLLSKLLSKFLYQIGYEECKGNRNQANDTAKVLMEVYWKPLDAEHVLTKGKNPKITTDNSQGADTERR